MELDQLDRRIFLGGLLVDTKSYKVKKQIERDSVRLSEYFFVRVEIGLCIEKSAK